MMNTMKKTISILIAVLMVLCLAACGNPEKTETEEQRTPAESTKEAVLVVYFSATGTTKGVAEKIAAITGGDLYEIVPAEPYSDADLNWNDRSSGIGRSGPNMEALAGSGRWLDGKRFGRNVSEADLRDWIDGLK